MVDALSRFAPNERHETLPNGARLHILPICGDGNG